MRVRRLVPVVAVLGLAASAQTAASGLADDTAATIAFDVGSGAADSVRSASTLPAGWNPGSLFSSFCWPPKAGEVAQAGEARDGTFTAGADGTLRGACTVKRSYANGGGIERESTITGRHDRASGKVSFRLEGTQLLVNVDESGATKGLRHTAATTLVVSADNVAVAGGRATGRARFTWALKDFSPVDHRLVVRGPGVQQPAVLGVLLEPEPPAGVLGDPVARRDQSDVGAWVDQRHPVGRISETSGVIEVDRAIRSVARSITTLPSPSSTGCAGAGSSRWRNTTPGRQR
jgi:hypothetical protein